MKKLIIISLSLAMVALVSCDKDNDVTEKKEANFEKLKSLSLKSASVSKLKKSNAVANKSNMVSNTECWGDSTYYKYESCITPVRTVDSEGNVTLVYDYGTEGCKEYGSLIKGKFTIKYFKVNSDGVDPDKSTEKNYKTEEKYENYSLDGFVMNGTMNMSSIVQENKDIISVNEENIVYTDPDGKTFTSTSIYKDIYNEDTYTVEKADYNFEGEGEIYKSKITKALVYNNKCEDSYIPVSGIEEVYSKYEDQVEEFKIDYGNGTCDNKATITQNGETKEIDYSSDDFYGNMDDMDDMKD